MRLGKATGLILLAGTSAWARPPLAGSSGPDSAVSPAHQAGAAAFRQGDYPEAIDQFEQERIARPENQRALTFLCFCYEKTGKEGKARACWRALLDAEPDSRLGVVARVRLTAMGVPVLAVGEREPSDTALAGVAVRPVSVRTEHFVVEAFNAALARRTGERAEAHLETIRANVLGTSLYPHQVQIRIHRTAAEYRRHVGAPHWSGGGFRFEPHPDGSMTREIHLVQLDADGQFNKRLFDVELPHELSHVVVAEFFGQRGCPVWLDEALAMMAEVQRDPERAEIMSVNVPFGNYVPFRELLDRVDWPPDYPMPLLYAQADSVGRFLWARLGLARGRDVLAQVRSGALVSEALARVLARPAGSGPFLDELEVEWEHEVISGP